MSRPGSVLNDDDGSLEAEDVLVGVLVYYFPFDGGSDRRIMLLHVQRERVGVALADGERACESASFAGVDVVGSPRDWNVKNDGVDLGLGRGDSGGRWQKAERDRGGDVGSPDDPASHVGRMGAAFEFDVFDLRQGRAAVLPYELISRGVEPRILHGSRSSYLAGGGRKQSEEEEEDGGNDDDDVEGHFLFF